MKKNALMFGAVLPLAMLALSATAPGQAAIVTYQASGEISAEDNAAQLPSTLSAANIGSELTVDFTVDTKAAGILNGPGDMSYADPLTSLSASVGSKFLGLDVALSQIEITRNVYSGGLYTSGYELFTPANVPTNFTGVASSFALIAQSSSATPQSLYKNTSLSNAPLQPAQASGLDGMLLQFTSYIDGVEQSSSDLSVTANVAIAKIEPGHAIAPEIDPASMTTALTLLIGGLMVMSNRRHISGRV